MAFNRITRSRAKLGGFIGNLDIPTCTWFTGTARVRQASTDSTRGGIQLGGMALFVKKIALTADWLNGGTTTQRDTSWDLPRFSIVDDVWVQTITAATSNTLSVGIQGDSDLFLAAVTPTSAFTPSAVTYLTGGGLVSNSTTYWYKVPYYSNSATSLSVVIGRSATKFSATWVGNVYIKYYVPST